MSASASWTAPAAIGGAAGLLIAAATEILGRRALRRGPAEFLSMSFLGVVWRTGAAVVIVALAAILSPTTIAPFTAAFVGAYLVGTAIVILDLRARLGRSQRTGKEPDVRRGP